MTGDLHGKLSSQIPAQQAPESAEDDAAVLALHADELSVTKCVRRTLVSATRRTSSRDVLVEEDLVREHVVVERVPIGRIVETAPPVRQEGDVTIVSVVEEEIVIQRRLILKEEVRFRREKAVERYSENVSLREQHVTVTRVVLED